MLPIITDLLKLLDRQDELLASSSEKWFQGNEIAALAGDVEGYSGIPLRCRWNFKFIWAAFSCSLINRDESRAPPNPIWK